MDFEDILTQVGDNGKYQKLFVLLFLLPITIIDPLYDYLFMLSTPDHWCNVPQLVNLTNELQSELIRPWTIVQGIKAKDRCNMFDIDYDKVANTLTLEFINKTGDIPIKKCDNGWKYDTSIFQETAITKHNLVCDDSHMVSTLFSLGIFGYIIMTLIISPLADRIGRRYAFLLIITIFAFTCISPIIFQNLTIFAITKSIAKGLQGVLFQIPYVMVMESVGPNHRTKVSIIAGIGYTIGICIMPGIAYITGHWVWLSIVQLLITIPFFIGWKFLPESAPWLLTQGRYAKAHAVVTKIAKVNGKIVPSDLIVQLKKVGKKHAEAKHGDSSDSIWDLFLVPQIRKNFIIITLILTANYLSYVGLNLNALNFHGNEFMNIFLLGLVDLPSQVLYYYCIEGPLGRRWTNTISLLICGVSLCASIFVPSSRTTIITILSLCGKFCISISYSLIFQQAAELIPTTLRTRGIGISTTIAYGINIILPFITSLGRYGIWIPMFIMGLSCLITGFAASFLPETLNECLPQNKEEAKAFGKNQKYFSLAKSKIITDNNNI